MKIEIAGPGCPRCITTENNVKEAVRQLGIDADIGHVFDIAKFAKRGVMFTPAVIINEKIAISGKVPTVDEIKKLIAEIRKEYEET